MVESEIKNNVFILINNFVMLTQDFCDALEYKINAMFEKSTNPVFKGFWCDGVLVPTYENEYSKEYANDNKKILLNAFIGNDGQQKFELTLNFGKKALSKYARDLDILDCLPVLITNDYWRIDMPNRKLFIQLI